MPFFFFLQGHSGDQSSELNCHDQSQRGKSISTIQLVSLITVVFLSGKSDSTQVCGQGSVNAIFCLPFVTTVALLNYTLFNLLDEASLTQYSSAQTYRNEG